MTTALPEVQEAEVTAGVRIEPGRSYGFFTDTTLCIGCKACEVACKEWNALPADDVGLTGQSYDNTGALSATTWRHVAFIEKLGAPSNRPPTELQPFQSDWLMMSDVCKHCANAACLEACPTGALFRTEFDTVVVQQDVCNGCGYCVPACPFGVIELDRADGKAHKCTLCYDRLKGGLEPACAKSCPTDSIQFGLVEELERRARWRLADLRARGRSDAYLYGVPELEDRCSAEERSGRSRGEGRPTVTTPGATGGIGRLNAFFLLTDRPEVYNLPTAPTLPSRRVRPGLAAGLATVAALAAAAAVSLAHERCGR